MLPDLETLRALADGELPPQRRAEVEAAVASDPELEVALRALFASRLPYQCAFARQQERDVPDDLRARVAELAAVAEASHEMALAGDGGGGSSAWAARMTSMRMTVLALLLLLLGVVAGYGAAGHWDPVRSGVAEPWVRMVASYHSMYGRETVSDGSSGAIQSEVLKQRLRLQGLELKVPDLSSVDLQFVRAQQLQFEGRTVLQMVFLPSEGPPVAVCLMRAASQPERTLVVDGVRALTWHAGEWAYVLVGALPLERMQAIRKAIPDRLI